MQTEQLAAAEFLMHRIITRPPSAAGRSMIVTVDRLQDLPMGVLARLISESEQAGWSFLLRLSDEWDSGANRFSKPGEAIFAAWAAGTLIGVCGLNVDPYTGDRRVGRVRHLYVLAGFRRLGVGPAFRGCCRGS